MKSRAAIVFALMLGVAARTQTTEPPDPFAELLRSANEWAQQNLDDRVLAVLEQVDQDRVQVFLGGLRKQFESSYVYDLGKSRESAKAMAAFLQQFEETRPYSVWLSTRIDLIEAAEELRRRQPAPPPQRGPPAPLPAPTAMQQRTVWDQRLAQRPMPEAARKLTPRLKPIFVAQKVPPQLVWIAEVESSFDVRAKSPSGAAGLFQIMKPTARSLGLSTWLPDERLNPEKSAKAAASYLKYLHGRFGDWKLALAAYNCGEGRVAELLKRSKAPTYESIASKLPAETQMYVPKIEATLRKREGVSLAELKVPRG